MKLAAIDIGSNSVHMIIAATTGGHAFEVIDRQVRLVTGVVERHRRQRCAPSVPRFGDEPLVRAQRRKHACKQFRGGS